MGPPYRGSKIHTWMFVTKGVPILTITITMAIGLNEGVLLRIQVELFREGSGVAHWLDALFGDEQCLAE